MQMMAVINEPRKCRACGKKGLKSYLEIEGPMAFVVVTRSKPDPITGSIFIKRAVFCNMRCFQQYVKKMVKVAPWSKFAGRGEE